LSLSGASPRRQKILGCEQRAKVVFLEAANYFFAWESLRTH
jgi:hypothetical protein